MLADGTFRPLAYYLGMDKTLFFAALFGLTLILSAADEISSAPSRPTTTPLRQSFEDKSSQDLRELRREIDGVYENTASAARTALAPYREALASAERELEELKIAPQSEFSSRREEFEQAKARAIELWKGYRQSVTPSEPLSTASTSASTSSQP